MYLLLIDQSSHIYFIPTICQGEKTSRGKGFTVLCLFLQRVPTHRPLSVSVQAILPPLSTSNSPFQGTNSTFPIKKLWPTLWPTISPSPTKRNKDIKQLSEYRSLVRGEQVLLIHLYFSKLYISCSRNSSGKWKVLSFLLSCKNI